VSLRKIITLYYSTIESGHSFPQFYQFVSKNKADILKVAEIKKEFFDIEDFLHITSEFVGNGIYSFLFSEDKDNSYRIKDKRFIIFELDQVKDNHVLLTIMLHLIQDAINKVVWKDRSTKGMVFFDEFAKMLKFPSVLTTAEYFYQAARKQEAAIGTVLQSPTQLPENDTSSAIIDNTQIFYILPNEKGYESVVQRFRLSNHDHIQCKSLKNNFSGKIKYSEFLLKIGSESNVMRLELPIEALYTYQSEGREYEAIMGIYEETKDMQKAVDTYIKYKSN
jgi:type IV secretory pathway VirB4 component